MKTYLDQFPWNNAISEDKEYINEFDENVLCDLWKCAEDKDGYSTEVFISYLSYIYNEGVMNSYELLEAALSNEAVKTSYPGSYLKSPLGMLMQRAFEWEAKKWLKK